MLLLIHMLSRGIRIVRVDLLWKGRVQRLRITSLVTLGLSLILLGTVSCIHVNKGPFDLGAAKLLGRLQSGESEFSLNRPKGSKYCKLVVVCSAPDGDSLRLTLQGEVVIKRDGENVIELPFTPETLKEGTGFSEKKGVAVCWLHWPKVLDESIKSSGEYVVKVVLTEKPRAGSELWLFYFPWHYGIF